MVFKRAQNYIHHTVTVTLAFLNQNVTGFSKPNAYDMAKFCVVIL